MKKFAHEKTYLYLKFYYFTRFLGDSFFYAFLYVYLSEINISAANIGIISAISPLAALFGSVLFKKITKNLNTNRTLLIIIGYLEAFVSLLFAIFGFKDFLLLAVLIGFAGMLNSPFYSLMDGYSGTYITKENKQYSSMRIMGAVAYIFGSFLGGLLANKSIAGYQISFAFSALFLALTATMTLFLPRQDVILAADTPSVDIKEKPSVYAVNAKFIIFLIFGFFIISFGTTMDNFFSVYLEDYHATSPQTYGLVVALSMIVETLAFLFLSLKKKELKNEVLAYLVIALAFLIRPFLVMVNAPTMVIYLLSSLRGVAWAYYLVFLLQYLTALLPLDKLTSSLFTVSIMTTIGRIISSLGMGELLELWDYNKTFTLLFIIMGVATLLVIVLSFIVRNKEKKIKHEEIV